LVNGVGEAIDRAKIAGIGFAGSKYAKKVFPALANEMGIEPSKLRDRLTLAWLDEHDADAQQLVAAIKVALG
jgi:hypothetical protein